uniref:Uncharacterized protein n=1 Tax=Coccidioides posadasii RMSCC 3488 TaxID=454284 RepID=A0A0J6FFC3_COCPO|nr:hypothetical protein CPAG_03907 [Coccidioides posadasii RMSCC 3488]
MPCGAFLALEKQWSSIPIFHLLIHQSSSAQYDRSTQALCTRNFYLNLAGTRIWPRQELLPMHRIPQLGIGTQIPTLAVRLSRGHFPLLEIRFRVCKQGRICTWKGLSTKQAEGGDMLHAEAFPRISRRPVVFKALLLGQLRRPRGGTLFRRAQDVRVRPQPARYSVVYRT